MLLRISLGIAILAAIGALYLGQVELAPKIAGLKTDLQTAQTERDDSQKKEKTAVAEAKKSKADMDAAKKELADTSQSLDDSRSKLSEQQNRANKLSTDLTKTTGERNEAREELSIWRAAGLTVDQVRGMKTQVAKLNEEREAIAGENTILIRSNRQLQNRLAIYEGDLQKDPEMPAGLKGKVLAVDPKYDFVVLDIGGNQGAVERGKLLISRAGKLVGAVRITKVEPTRSIANIIADLKQSDVLEGDQVLY